MAYATARGLLRPTHGSQQRRSRASHYTELATRLERLTKRVESSWEGMPEPDRETLAALAYASIEEPQGVERWSNRVSNAVVSFTAAMRGEGAAWAHFLWSFEELNLAVLSAIERSDPALQAEISDAINELESIDLSTLPDVGDPHEWLADISREAASEV